MKSLTRRMSVLSAVIVIAVLMIVGSSMLFTDCALAQTDASNAYEYFYDQIKIDKIAERFYKAFETLDKSGEFKKGKLQYDLIANGVATKEEVEAYVNGMDGNRLAKSFGKGRDAYYMDHPDLFYVDLFSTSITAGMQNGNYVAYLDSSRTLSMYRGDSISSEAAVDEAIKKYNDAIAPIVDGANALSGAVEKIEYVNDYICDVNKYGFGTEVQGDKNVDTPKADFIHTSYGALVHNESVCEGYAKSFKAVMDRLGIPCVCVAGYSAASGKENLQPHMWNYVQVDGMWYIVDVTFNSTSSQNRWMLKGGQFVFDTHLEDGSVSSSGFELRYPALKPYDYGVDDDDNGMTVIGSYTDTDNQGKTLELSVSYEGKGALKLQEEGKYLAYSFGVRDGKREIEWSKWVNIVAANNAVVQMDRPMIYPITDNDTKMNGIGTSVEFIRFALIKRPPDEKGDYHTGDTLVSYNKQKLTDEDFWGQPSAPYRNEGFGSYDPAPGAAGVYPSNGGSLPVDKTYDIRIVYNTALELDAGYTLDSIEMDFYTSRGNDTIKQNAVLENLKWDGDKTITFTLTPSKMYIHNDAMYYFTPVGLVGAKSKKVPDPVMYSFKGKSVVCSKIFNDGRLYMNVFGEPNLLDNSDISVTDFKDENGKYYAASQRSQLMLVATKPTQKQEEEMDDVLKRDTGVKEEEILASSTYEINLQICGVVQKVPNGSYMQVAFGFPEGYSPDDAGTTFKIYHYKHDSAGNITGVEEIPVIVTEYGLIAKVQSFSPFTIVQVKNTSAAVQNSKTSNIYAYVNGEVGGRIVTSDGKSGISQVSKKITYSILPDNGYAIACVRLNGKVVEPKNYSDGKLTLAKSDIQDSNMLEVTFMSQEFATSYAKQGVSISYGEMSDFSSSKTNVAGIVIGCLVGVAVLVALAVTLWFVLKKRQEKSVLATVAESPQKSTSSVASKNSAAKQSKPTEKASPVKDSNAFASAKSTAAATKSSATASKSEPKAKQPTAATKTASKASKSETKVKSTVSSTKQTTASKTETKPKSTASATKSSTAKSGTAKQAKTEQGKSVSANAKTKTSQTAKSTPATKKTTTSKTTAKPASKASAEKKPAKKK